MPRAHPGRQVGGDHRNRTRLRRRVGALVLTLVVLDLLHLACKATESGPSPTPPSQGTDAGRGPQASITCPPAALHIAVGADIRTIVERAPANSTFCLEQGLHVVAGAVTPKSGDTFIGEYGAILDGSGWSSADPNDAAFRAHHESVQRVTIRNLVIRNMPQRAIHAFGGPDGWIIESNELTGCDIAVNAPSDSVVRQNAIHHNRRGGYSAYKASDVLFEDNEIAFNGREQKIVGTTGVTFRNNFVHDNAHDGIWYDTDNTGALIEGNRVEDNGRDGISYEVSGQGVVRHNTVRRNASSGILVATSKNVEIAGNLADSNRRGIHFLLNCGVVGGGTIGWDLSDDTAHDNTVIVGTAAGALASALADTGGCTPAALTPYLDGSKRLRFEQNTYEAPDAAERYWGWGSCCLKSWSEWQALGLDGRASFQARSR